MVGNLRNGSKVGLGTWRLRSKVDMEITISNEYKYGKPRKQPTQMPPEKEEVDLYAFLVADRESGSSGVEGDLLGLIKKAGKRKGKSRRKGRRESSKEEKGGLDSPLLFSAASSSSLYL